MEDLRLKAVETLRMLGTSSEEDRREEFLYSVLKIVYQSGVIDNQSRIIMQNTERLPPYQRLDGND